MTFLLHFHPLISFTLVAVICSGIASSCLLLTRSGMSEDSLRENHEVAGFIFNAIGMIYAVLIAFVVYVTWTNYDGTKRNVEMEAAKLSDLYADAGAFGEPV